MILWGRISANLRTWILSNPSVTYVYDCFWWSRSVCPIIEDLLPIDLCRVYFGLCFFFVPFLCRLIVMEIEGCTLSVVYWRITFHTQLSSINLFEFDIRYGATQSRAPGKHPINGSRVGSAGSTSSSSRFCNFRAYFDFLVDTRFLGYSQSY